MNTPDSDSAWVDQFASALSRLDMPETATIDLLLGLGKTLHETQAHLSPQVAAELERAHWPPLNCFPKSRRRLG